MKKIRILVLFLFLLTFNGFSQPFNSDLEFQMMKEEDPNYKIERQKWMDDMHRVAPGYDWREINKNILDKKYFTRKRKIENLLRGDVKIDQIQSDTVADGKIIGQWIERGSNNLAGRMLTCDIDWEQNIIYAASSGGNIWKGTLEGENWKCLNNGRKMGNVTLLKIIKFNNTTRILLFSGRTGFYSDNEGLTWETSKGLNKTRDMRRSVMTIDDHLIYFLGTEKDSANKDIQCVYISNDYGENYELIYRFYSNKNMSDIWTPKYYAHDVILLRQDTLSKIEKDGTVTDIGVVNLDSNLSSFKEARLSGCFNSDESRIYLYLKNKSNNYSHFYSTNDFGQTWNTLGILDYGPFSINSFEVSAKYADACYFGGVNCSRSWDGGKTWELVNSWGEYYKDMENKLHADLPAITSFVNPSEDEFTIVSTDGGSYSSTDQLYSVKNISLYHLNVSQYYGSYTFRDDPDVIFVGAQDQGFQRTTSVDEDGTHSFEQTISGDYGHLTSSDGGETLWHVYPGFTMLYKNLAYPNQTKSDRLDFKETGTGGLWMRPILADPADPNIAYLAGGGTDGFNHIWKLNFNEIKIRPEEMPYQFSQGNNVVSALGISNLNTELFYAMTNNGDFFYSTDRGNDWTLSEGFARLGGHYFYGASIAPSNVNENTVYIAGSGYSNPGAYVSYDHGVNFTPIDSGLPNTLVYRIAVSENDEYLFAATAVGPYIYISSEGKWYDLSDIHAPDQTYWSVEYIPSIRTARFCTYGRGIWDFKIDGQVDNKESEHYSQNVNLSVSPNPFSDNSQISFSIHKNAEVSLKIYDLQGKELMILIDSYCESGDYNYQLNSESLKANQNSRVFFVKLTVSGKEVVKKLIYLN